MSDAIMSSQLVYPKGELHKGHAITHTVGRSGDRRARRESLPLAASAEREPRRAWRRADKPVERDEVEREWLGVRDDFGNWLIRAA